MSSLFTLRSPSDGNFAQGAVPPELLHHLEALARLYLGTIPQESHGASTHHQWCQRSSPEMRDLVAAIKNHPLWEQLGDGTAAVVDLGAMDELYYSRLPKDRTMLYGAAANFDLHVDGIFAFPGVRVYRVLIGLTDNEHVEAQFPGLGVGHRIGKGDFIVFDFDRARHQVVRLPDAPEDGYRILLKLHFCVVTAGGRVPGYVRFVLWAYRFYEGVTRRIMAAGTDPRTPAQFALGILGQFAVRRPRLFRLGAALPVVAAVLRCAGEESVSTWLLVAFVMVIGLWLATACYRWLRYRCLKAR